jgi:hypothetical protein
MRGHFTGSAVLVREGSELLHPWLQGWYGELVYEASWAPRLPHSPAEGASNGAPKVLHLSLTEAFYLAYVVLDTPPRLSVESSCGLSSVPLSEPEAWLAFSAAQPRFAHNLAAFCALRQAGWYVRCGLKYGADFALYAADGESAAPATPPPRLPPHHRAGHHTTATATTPPHQLLRRLHPHTGQPGSSLRQMNAVESTPPTALWCTRRHWETSQAAGRVREVTKGWPTVLPRLGGSIHGQWRRARAVPCCFERTGSWCSRAAACAARVSNPVYPACNPIHPGSRCSSTLASADRSPKGCSCAPSRRQGASPHLQ